MTFSALNYSKLIVDSIILHFDDELLCIYLNMINFIPVYDGTIDYAKYMNCKVEM